MLDLHSHSTLFTVCNEYYSQQKIKICFLMKIKKNCNSYGLCCWISKYIVCKKASQQN